MEAQLDAGIKKELDIFLVTIELLQAMNPPFVQLSLDGNMIYFEDVGQ